MGRTMVSLGAASVRCPHCNGDGYREIGDVSYGDYMQAEARVCSVCTNGDDWYPRGNGYLDLPLTADQADRICEAACDCCDGLVS